jgi:CRISPR system Cascade subunit CasC
MARFIQLHLLTSYPPANLNRDDLGRPKTAVMGGANRLRVSSQCLKRNWRVSDIFKEALGRHVGTRTKRMGPDVYERLVEGGRTENQAEKATKAIVDQFGDLESKKKHYLHKQVVHYSPAELEAIDNLVETLTDEQRDPEDEELELLREEHSAVDVAMFGRMLASTPKYNVEAAVQVAHALTVHEAVVEDDFFTAVDDLNDGRADSGSAHMGVTEFGAGLFYIYICIDRAQLVANLQEDEELAERAIHALTEAAAKVAPSGKQNSFGSRAYASIILAEKGDQQPRSLSVAFLKPVNSRGNDDGLLALATSALEETRQNMDKSYGACSDDHYTLNAAIGEGSLEGLQQFLNG